MNECHFIGNLARDPEARTFQSGSQKVSFGLAIGKRVKDTATGKYENKAIFVECEAWGKTGELILEHFKKGDLIVIANASVDVDQWENDGKKHSRVYFRVNNFEFPATPRKKDNRETATASTTDDGSDIPF